MPGGVLRPHDLPVLHDHLRVQGEPVAAGLLRWVGGGHSRKLKKSVSRLLGLLLFSFWTGASDWCTSFCLSFYDVILHARDSSLLSWDAAFKLTMLL